MWITVKQGLLFELKFTRKFTVASNLHCSMVIAVYFTEDKIINASCNLKLK